VTLGLDVSPDVVTVDSGVHLVLDVVNRTDERHDLALDGGARRTTLLAPGRSQRLDLGIVRHGAEAWCTLPGHKLLGMAMAIHVSAPPR
jgi:nitrite reductase (NO-forming)